VSAQPQQVLAPTSLLKSIRAELHVSQQAFSELLGCSLRAVQSAEQGWRHTSPALEKLALLLFVSLRRGRDFSHLCCWETNNCPAEHRERCLTYRFRQGHLCWFLTSTMCSGHETQTWEEKRDMCLKCSFFRAIVGLSHGELANPESLSPPSP
jgi:transcriptional regulator with XRE-family HTH domain